MQPGAAGAAILLAGNNFGCGSSREHAPWALRDWGFRAVIARSFADIFCQNALKNGLLPVALDEASHRAIVAAREADAALQIHVDLVAQQLSLAGGEAFSFSVPPFARRCLLQGTDELGYILSFSDRILAWEHDHRTA